MKWYSRYNHEQGEHSYPIETEMDPTAFGLSVGIPIAVGCLSTSTGVSVKGSNSVEGEDKGKKELKEKENSKEKWDSVIEKLKRKDKSKGKVKSNIRKI